ISADGKKLVYGLLAINSNLWGAPISTRGEGVGQPVALTRDSSYRNSNPKVSPDGTRIAYHVTRVGTQADIYVMNADGTNQTQVTTNPGYDERPSWFPDNEQILFLTSREG